MAKKKFTPEEQLLELIEKRGERWSEKIRRKKGFSLNLAKLKKFGRKAKRESVRNASSLKARFEKQNLKTLNKMLLIACVALIGYSATDFIFKSVDIGKIHKKGRVEKHEKVKEPAAVKPRPFVYYLEMVQRRNIFSPIGLEEVKKPEIKEEDLSKMVEDLILVGISWGKEPIAMVEDKKIKKTYFLRKGDAINQFKVDDVAENKVILGYNGCKLELM